jgi:SOS-response transcriptional repressor LexA
MFETHSLIVQEPADKAELTPGERGVLGALIRAISLHGNPSVAEIADCATATVFSAPSAPMIHKYLRRLERKGYVELKPRRARSIRLLRTGNEE